MIANINQQQIANLLKLLILFLHNLHFDFFQGNLKQVSTCLNIFQITDIGDIS